MCSALANARQKQVAWGCDMSHSTAIDYSALLEPMTAREYRRRNEPGTLEFMLNVEAALREDLERAEAIAAEYGLEPSKSGRYPRLIWDRVATRY
jgi:hypothetical protein